MCVGKYNNNQNNNDDVEMERKWRFEITTTTSYLNLPSTGTSSTNIYEYLTTN
jgi:hypothetical protein